MLDPLAQRVASRFLQAGPAPEVLLHNTESAMHRAQELLRAMTQQHAFLTRAMTSAEPFDQVAKLHHKIHPLMEAYEAEVQRAMASLDEYEHAER